MYISILNRANICKCLHIVVAVSIGTLVLMELLSLFIGVCSYVYIYIYKILCIDTSICEGRYVIIKVVYVYVWVCMHMCPYGHMGVFCNASSSYVYG